MGQKPAMMVLGGRPSGEIVAARTNSGGTITGGGKRIAFS